MWREIAKQWIPPAMISMYHALRGNGIRFRGTYTTWESAARQAVGYDSQSILQKVRAAALKVKSGEAVAERDSVLFDQVPYPFPLIAFLLRAACEGVGGLSVLDFGGALGSSYYQCKDFLTAIKPLHWHIVEQPAFVECGRNEFETDVVRFFDSIDSSVESSQPDVVLISGVLQYLPNPMKVLAALTQSGAKYIILDRTPITANGKQIITVQMISEAICQSSYPAWLFSEPLLKQPLLSDYEEIADFNAVDGVLGGGSLKACFKGLVFRRKKALQDRSE